MLISLSYSTYRWSLLLFYFLRGRKTKGRIAGEEKSRFLIEASQASYYYRVYYVYYDEKGILQRGKMSKLYRQGRFEPGREINIRYLPFRPEKSICLTLYEFFSYEIFSALIFLFIFLSTTIL